LWNDTGHPFAAMFKRGRLELDEALAAVAMYRQIPIRFVEIELEEPLQIAQALDSYAYDAQLLRCAGKTNAKCASSATMDKYL
jgi:predicted nucleic acid-binding protein